VIEIRSCEGFDELEACVQLEIETWGYDESETIPRKTFLVAQTIGGQVMGAFDTEIAGSAAKSMVGFVFSLPGVKTGAPSDGSMSLGWDAGKSAPKAYLHSHMLAVKEAYRNRGLGTQLKLAQRREALGRGIRHMEWTFDPLEIKNAFLNIHRLGAIVLNYRVDFYGVSSSRLQAGLPTDRLVAEWELDSPRVQAILDGLPVPEYVIEERIQVPAQMYAWKRSESGREQALAVQQENRRKFLEAFSQGLAVVGFDRDAEGKGVFELGPVSQLEQD
jgi:predicted GNAT superfamily acetyltransferase